MSLAFAARHRLGIAALVALIGPAAATAQQTPATPPPETGPKVGQVAPDFSLPGASRYGLLRDPVTLSAFRGKTVVLAFFVKARTRG